MKNNYIALGLMSGTSGDGVDASIIESDGQTSYRVHIDKYFKYDSEIYENIHILKDKIKNLPENLIKYSSELQNLEKKITLSLELEINDFPVSLGLFILSAIGEIFLYFFETRYAISLNFPLL